ncbi:hypothetical protein WMY93_026359 [Mugilogobius chulae]|uniref:Uncharacterized protein n=1 Tax=Mugilogobius chulae TaxID=88201 RepID=A0AAW0N790_9GOBI
MNARPLVPVTTDPETPEILSPAMLLTQKASPVLSPPGNFELKDLYKAQWRQVQVCASGERAQAPPPLQVRAELSDGRSLVLSRADEDLAWMMKKLVDGFPDDRDTLSNQLLSVLSVGASPDFLWTGPGLGPDSDSVKPGLTEESGSDPNSLQTSVRPWSSPESRVQVLVLVQTRSRFSSDSGLAQVGFTDTDADTVRVGGVVVRCRAVDARSTRGERYASSVYGGFHKERLQKRVKHASLARKPRPAAHEPGRRRRACAHSFPVRGASARSRGRQVPARPRSRPLLLPSPMKTGFRSL